MILRFIRNNLWIPGLLLILLFTGYVSVFWYQLMLLQGDSMEPSYHSGQLLILDRHTESYQYGDVVAVKKEGIPGLLVKRLAALPGDTVSIQDGILYRNGSPMTEWHTPIRSAGIAAQPLTLDEDCYFVLGDNTAESRDSRFPEIGVIHLSEIRGKVLGGKLSRQEKE